MMKIRGGASRRFRDWKMNRYHGTTQVVLIVDVLKQNSRLLCWERVILYLSFPPLVLSYFCRCIWCWFEHQITFWTVISSMDRYDRAFQVSMLVQSGNSWSLSMAFWYLAGHTIPLTSFWAEHVCMHAYVRYRHTDTSTNLYIYNIHIKKKHKCVCIYIKIKY